MKSPKWVATTRQLIKSNHGFGWSISGWERNNKFITKVVYRYQDGSRNSILVDLDWSSDNSGKMINLVEERFKTNEGMFTTSGDLAEEFIDEFAGSKVKALATLNSLEKKKLIYSKPRNFEGKGLVSIFYPNKK